MFLVEPLEKSLRRAPRGGLEQFKGGQFITASLWEEQKRLARIELPRLLDRSSDRLQTLRAFYEQNAALEREGVTKVKLVPLATIETRMKTAIRESYQDAFTLGKRAAGNLTALTDSDLSAIKKVRLDEYKYLAGFTEDIRNDIGKMPYIKRMDMYVAAARELYWLGWVLGDRRTDRRIEWALGPTEHCESCLRTANNGPYTVEQFIEKVLPLLPQSGRLDCLGHHCQCSLREVKKV